MHYSVLLVLPLIAIAGELHDAKPLHLLLFAGFVAMIFLLVYLLTFIAFALVWMLTAWFAWRIGNEPAVQASNA